MRNDPETISGSASKHMGGAALAGRAQSVVVNQTWSRSSMPSMTIGTG
jgi:hypothetical protein